MNNTELIARAHAKAASFDDLCWFLEAALIRELVNALEAAQLVGEPVAIFRGSEFRNTFKILKEIPTGAKLYTHPAPQVPMTDKEIAGAWISIPDPIALGGKFNGSDAVRDFVRAIEAHHKIGVKS